MDPTSLVSGDDRRKLILVAFVATATIVPLSMVFGCGTNFNTMPYDSALLEESLAFMGSAKDQHHMTSKGA